MSFISIYGRSVIGFLCSSLLLLYIPIMYDKIGEFPSPPPGFHDFTKVTLVFMMGAAVLYFMCFEIAVVSLFQALLLYLANKYVCRFIRYYSYVSAIVMGLLYNLVIIAYMNYAISINDIPEAFQNKLLANLLFWLPIVILVAGFMLYVRIRYKRELPRA